MSYMPCTWLIPQSGCVVSHGLKKAPNRFLIVACDAAELLNNAIFVGAQSVCGQRRAQAVEDIGDVKSKLARDFAQIRRRRIARTSFVICLGPFGYSKRFCDLVLRQTAALTFFLQSGAYLFGKVQNYSSLIFTNAPKCIILHLTPHENARNCTMPNTSITEQARQQARDALEKRGQSAKDFAEQHNLNPSTVYAVLSGQSRCRRGEAHRAAVLLGIKDGVIEQ